MAIVEILISDNPDGTVGIKVTPDVKALIRLHKEGGGLTSGQAYALAAIRKIGEDAADNRRANSRIILPDFRKLSGLS